MIYEAAIDKDFPVAEHDDAARLQEIEGCLGRLKTWKTKERCRRGRGRDAVKRHLYR